MKRFGIFVFYNEQGKVESYVELLLESMLEILEELVIVINGTIQNEEKIKFYRYTQKIYQRENIGYDGGAYKDVFLIFLKDKVNWKQWDEIILFNDTFYGPFFHWDNVFLVMEKRKCDFWGLTVHSGGVSGLFNGITIPMHLQSYFIVFKKKIFNDFKFWEFWEKLKYPESYKMAVMEFEIYLSEYFMKLDFCFESWFEVQKESVNINKVYNYDDICQTLVELSFPILKRKKVVLQDYINLKKFFQYIKKYTEYPTEAIKEDVLQRCKAGKIKPYNPQKILWFCMKYEKIYLYGKGSYAKNIEQFICDNGGKISGYLVSKKENKDKRILEFSKFKIKPNEGIIVALNQKNFREVYLHIINKIPPNQMICPIYDEC